MTAAGRLRQLLAGSAGWLLVAMVALAIAHGVMPSMPSWPAGACAWLAGGLLLRRTRSTQQILLAVLIVLGGLAMVFSLSQGVTPEWVHLLDANVPLLAMIASVGFLRLVAGASETTGASLPVGFKAFRHTVFSVGILGSVINISAPILVGDRLAINGKLQRLTSQTITRTFSACSAWSPFFGGMAMVLTYVSSASLNNVMLAGLPFALIGMTVIIIEARLRFRREVNNFRGYPISVSSLWVPVVLAGAVALGSVLMPGVKILYVIAIAALLVVALVLVARQSARGAVRTLHGHVRLGLPGMAGELLLFLGAGVLAVGLNGVVETGAIVLPIHSFSPTVAGALLASIVLVSGLGLHPVISVAVVTPLLTPLDPSPTLLAVTFMFGWSLGTCISPLSGTHLVFQGRFGVPSYQAAWWNLPYVLTMLVVGIALLQIEPMIWHWWSPAFR